MVSNGYVQTVSERIQQLRYNMLVHSYLYYELGETIIDDHTFDARANELVALQEKFPVESKKTKYYEEFKDFTGSTGFDLPYRMPNIIAIAHRQLTYHRGKVNEG